MQPYSGSSPRGWLPPEGATLFVGNLAYDGDIDEMKKQLATAIEDRIGGE